MEKKKGVYTPLTLTYEEIQGWHMKECAWHRARGTLSAASAQAGDWETHNFRIWNAQAPGFRIYWKLSREAPCPTGDSVFWVFWVIVETPVESLSWLLQIVPQNNSGGVPAQLEAPSKWGLAGFSLRPALLHKADSPTPEASLWSDTGQEGPQMPDQSVTTVGWMT